jgi:phosphoglycolate phosphatase
MEKAKLQVIFPGIGYHYDKPLLYYARKVAKEAGYEEVINISYSAPLENIRGDREKMEKTFESMYQQAEENLKDVVFENYSDVIFISKSIGTVIAAAYARKHGLGNVRHILYTPLKDTVLALEGVKEIDAIAFIGSADPWSNVPEVIELAEKNNLPLHVYEGVNHSLEAEDTLANLDILKDVMAKSKKFM